MSPSAATVATAVMVYATIRMSAEAAGPKIAPRGSRMTTLTEICLRNASVKTVLATAMKAFGKTSGTDLKPVF